MALANYTDLKSNIASYLARTDLTSTIPTFIQLAEIRLRRDIRINEMLNNATLTPVAGVVTLPTDFLEMRSIYFNLNPLTTLEYQTPDLFSRNGFNDTSGTSVYFTIIANTIQFSPDPDSTDTVQMLYYAKPEYLSDTNLTNVWTDNCMDAILYASLAEASLYLMDNESAQRWATLYDRGLSAIKTSNEGKKYPNIELAVTAR
jgi:hypothetical protein